MKLLDLLVPYILLSSVHLNAQIIWTEDFSAGSAARGTLANSYPGSSGGNWTQINNYGGGGEGSAANQWYVSGEECGNLPPSCGTACSNLDASLHVSAIGGLCGTPDCGAAYDASNATNITDKLVISPTINTTGYGGLTLTFNYIAAQGDDKVFPMYSCNNGATWTAFTPLPATLCCGFFGGSGTCGTGFNFQGLWTTINYSLPICAENNAGFKIGFRWVNDGDGLGTDPSIAIDDIQINSTIVLPVELVTFEGRIVDTNHELFWQTASESNSYGFEILASQDGINFYKIGFIRGNENSQELLNYTFLTEPSHSRKTYYQLKHIDIDGQYALSRIISLESPGRVLNIYPNPATNEITIDLPKEIHLESEITIFNVLGIPILKLPLVDKSTQISIDVEHLPSGSYFIECRNSSQYYTGRFMK